MFFTAPLTWSADPHDPDKPVYQMGLFSMAMGGCGSKTFPDLFTRLTSLSDWLSDIGISRGQDSTGLVVPTYVNKCPVTPPSSSCNPACGPNASCWRNENNNTTICKCNRDYAGDAYAGCGKSMNYVSTFQN